MRYAEVKLVGSWVRVVDCVHYKAKVGLRWGHERMEWNEFHFYCETKIKIIVLFEGVAGIREETKSAGYVSLSGSYLGLYFAKFGSSAKSRISCFL